MSSTVNRIIFDDVLDFAVLFFLSSVPVHTTAGLAFFSKGFDGETPILFL
eukprot:CAMPEP_0202974592 /NCGR_PEP_ID=MMETSP1396-20130829/61800_1 /ASSEMBLY_ACC=CAM_ASM_000872 /TAXON_ID= /ORGANISM="Pseudokeronopsis sp., Strain Brazil" /LENGTH=49 /DNA_ID= /DNA_START= /DNA_END= /DNA_ORIENTATION=